mmetsp:Transcript_56790/g.169572  ORF Transcript_56790/g.169572 Transcript_56790/m.169572 type:complete len:300 (-) Transcript_56790:270-1169(-)
MGRRSGGKQRSSKLKRGGGGGGKSKSGKDAGEQTGRGATSAAATTTEAAPGPDGFFRIDPRRVRFQYSRIRPIFSGCGRSVESTLESIRRGELDPDHLPPILVLVGPPTHSTEGEEGGNGGRWYFSLNNRRLWVLKRCREEGLLEGRGNTIRVRAREWKSDKERERYTVEKCALEAKFIRETTGKKGMRKPPPRGDNEREYGVGGSGSSEEGDEKVGCRVSGGDAIEELSPGLVLDGGDDSSCVNVERVHEDNTDNGDSSSDDASDGSSGGGGISRTTNRFAFCGFDSDSDSDSDSGED